MAQSFLFPGQGSQKVGMGKALADAFPVAREVFQEVDEALSQPLSKIIFEGPMEDLTMTSNTQPALMAVSIAAMRVLEKEAGASAADAMYVAGHSLGEYSALCAAGAISLADTARLLRIRGDAMQEAVPVGEGAMAALIGVDIEGAEKAIKAILEGATGVCEIANDNAPGQVVVSGSKRLVEKLAGSAREYGIKLAKILPVSAPFHSSLMAPAGEKMRAALADCEIRSPETTLIANVTAGAVASADDIRVALVEQVTGRVRWTESVEAMVAGGCTKFVEVGAGNVLTGLLRRINRDATGMAVGEPGDLEAFAKF